jgi:hypothetical protein
VSEEIQIIGKHPHVGERGLFDGAGMVLNGKTLYLIELIDCKHGVERCYADAENIGRMIVIPIAARRKKRVQ